MHLLKFPSLLFLSSVVTGTTLALCATNWLAVFAGMELNLLAFIPLMIQSKTSPEHESATKYLLSQTLGAFALMLGGLWAAAPMLHPLMPKWLLLVGLMTKLGAAPLHFWFPNVMTGLSWPLCIILSTWQKLFPLLSLFFLLNSSSTPSMLIILAIGALMSAHAGLNQTTLRGLLAYSSITHINWMLAVSILNTLCATLYCIIYILTTSMIMLSFLSLNLSAQKITALASLSPPTKLALATMLLSLASLPPLLGFLPKWQGLEAIALTTPMAAIPLLLASITTLFFYLKLSFLLFLTPSSNQSSSPTATSYLIIFPLIISLNLIPLSPLFIYALTLLNQS